MSASQRYFRASNSASVTANETQVRLSMFFETVNIGYKS